MGTPTSDVRYTLSEKQRAFVEDEHPFCLFLGGVGAGKSYAGAVRALRRFGAGPPSLGLVVSPTYPMLRDATWRTALEVWAPLVERAVAADTRIVLSTGDEVLFRSADDPERLRGPNASWAWIDEAALCHPATWPIVIGRLRQHGRLGEAWLTTTPKGQNWVYEVFVVQATDQTSIHRAATWSNPFIAPDFVRSLSEQYAGDFAAQELEAEWVTDQVGTLIGYQLLDGARTAPAAYAPERGPVIAGIDVAGPGEDETVVVIRQGAEVLDLKVILESDARGRVVATLLPWRHRGLRVANVDSAGLGYYLARAVEDAEIPVRDINVGARPTSDDAREKYANLKAELYWGLRERFEAGDVRGLTDKALIGQLAGIKYDHDARGRVKIESKERAVSRGVKSPDRAEALMLAFCPEDPAAARAALYGLRTRPAE